MIHVSGIKHVKRDCKITVNCLFFSLVILVVFNALLFYKLWSLEQKATIISYNTQDLWTDPL